MLSPWDNNSVAEVYCSHFLEHLTNFDGRWERVIFFNELWRIIVPNGTVKLIFPHWCSTRHYGDPTHKEPFSEMGFFYLDRNWRKQMAPHTDIAHNPKGYDCHWKCEWGYQFHDALIPRNDEYRNFALQWYKEAAQDVHATLTALK